jgi:hypothetical protein
MKVDIENAELKITGLCQCGGQLVQVTTWYGRKLLEWKCERSRFWNRRRGHAYLVTEARMMTGERLVPAEMRKLLQAYVADHDQFVRHTMGVPFCDCPLCTCVRPLLEA